MEFLFEALNAKVNTGTSVSSYRGSGTWHAGDLLTDNTEETEEGCTLYQCVEEDMEIDNVLDMICEEDVDEV